MKVYEALAAACRRQSAGVAFGLVGDGNVKFVHAWSSGGGRYVAARHESGAVSMAVGYRRATGRTGLATVTQGPGFTNTLTALTAAVRGRVPIVLLTGLPPTTLPGHPQAIDQEALLQDVGAGFQPLSIGTAAQDVADAFRRAESERRPIALCVPTDVQDTDLRAPSVTAADGVPAADPQENAEADRAAPDPTSVRRAADLIEAAVRPVVVAGRGVLASPGAREALVRLADRIGALLATTLPVRGLFAGHPYDVGVMGGFAADLTRERIAKADCVLAFGSSLNYRSTQSGALLWDSAVVVQCDIESQPAGASVKVDHRLHGDAAAAAAALVAELERRGVTGVGDRSDELADRLATGDVHENFVDETNERGVDPRSLMRHLDEILPLERSLTVDGGHSSGFPSVYLRVPDQQGYLFSLEFASIGLGLGTAIGAAVGRPDRLSVLVIGDGALMMSLPDLETAARHTIPVLIVVMNDHAYGSELAILSASGLPPDVGLFRNPSFAQVADSMGADGLTVTSLKDLDGVEERVRDLSGPLIVDCQLNPDVRGAWLKGAFNRSLAAP